MPGRKPPFTRTLPSLGPTLDFLRLLWELDHALQRRSKRMSVEIGLTGPQRLVLRIVGRFPGIRAGDLAALISVHPSTLTGVVQRLERGGWLKRRCDPRDRRRTLLGLSLRGRELDAAHSHTIEGALRRVLEPLPGSDIEAVRRILRALTGELANDSGADERTTGPSRTRTPYCLKGTAT